MGATADDPIALGIACDRCLLCCTFVPRFGPILIGDCDTTLEGLLVPATEHGTGLHAEEFVPTDKADDEDDLVEISELLMTKQNIISQLYRI